MAFIIEKKGVAWAGLQGKRCFGYVFHFLPR